MKKTLILVVDRDDDFGVKGLVETPAVGLPDVMSAAIKLGVVDPEDSDVNTIFAAIKIYNELEAEGRNVEIALICGDTKVGYRSDIKIVDELERVINDASPDRAILVSDGAEDEVVYPIITSRLKVDSIKKVYVKQAPGIESAFYTVTKMLRDSDKRKRFLAPIGLSLMAVALVFMLPEIYMYLNTNNLVHIYNMTGSTFVLMVGLILVAYAYRVGDRMNNYLAGIMNGGKNGDPAVIFTVLAIVLFIVGIVTGSVYASTPTNISMVYRIMLFGSNSMWVILFAYLCNEFGKFLSRYVEKKEISTGFIVGGLTLFAVAFVIQAGIDALMTTLTFKFFSAEMMLAELGLGFLMAIIALVLKYSFGKFIKSNKTAESQDGTE